MQMDMRPEYIQKMMLTPKMLLSMHVLQLNIMDLKIFMQAELEENPLLEEEVSDEVPNENEVKIIEELSVLIDEDLRDEESPVVAERVVNAENEEKRHYLESLVTKKESLYDHLHWQLNVLAKDNEERRIGEFIIGNLDDDGFLTMELEKMHEQVNADTESFKRALSLIRSLDPIGIGARDIKESLLIQLISSGKGNTRLYKIVYSHLEDLEKGNYEKIAGALSISIEEVEKAKKRISHLNPKPGSSFGIEEAASAIIPDVFFLKSNGAYEVEVNDEELPKLKISHFYKTVLKDKNVSKEAKRYVKQKFLDARWFINAVVKRNQTITSVCEHLVEVQSDFLEGDEDFLKPLTLKQVAEKLSMSEATISRVVSNKYAQIFNRLFALKTLFARGLKTTEGKIIPDRSIKQRILNLVEEEDPVNPLSDDKIASILKKEGINIARRTVAKYRKNLKILPSQLRKRHKGG